MNISRLKKKYIDQKRSERWLRVYTAKLYTEKYIRDLKKNFRKEIRKKNHYAKIHISEKCNFKYIENHFKSLGFKTHFFSSCKNFTIYWSHWEDEGKTGDDKK